MTEINDKDQRILAVNLLKQVSGKRIIPFDKKGNHYYNIIIPPHKFYPWV